MIKIIYAPDEKSNLFVEDIWKNLICGYDVQIIETILSINAKVNVFYSPSTKTSNEIISSVKKVFSNNCNFFFNYFETLQENIFRNSLTLVTDNVKIARNYHVLTGNTTVLHFSYSMKNIINSNERIIVSDTLKILKCYLSKLIENNTISILKI